MNMRLALVAAGLAIGTLVGATAAMAASVDLATDFSNTNNPNGQWSIKYGAGSTLLPHQGSVQNNGNHLVPAIPGDGFFGTGSNLNADTPFVFKSAADGSSLAGLTDEDFVTGDIVVHSPNDGSNLIIEWAAPSAGTITNLAVSAWYAHSNVARSNEFSVSLANVVLDSFTLSDTQNTGKSNAGTYADAGPIAVNAGDLLTLTISKTLLQSFGSLAGVSASFDFVGSTVPIPAALPLFVSALAGLGWIARRRKQAAA